MKLPELELMDSYTKNLPDFLGECIKSYAEDYGKACARAALEEAAKVCEERGASYKKAQAPGWHEVDHESAQCAAAIRAIEVE